MLLKKTANMFCLNMMICCQSRMYLCSDQPLRYQCFGENGELEGCTDVKKVMKTEPACSPSVGPSLTAAPSMGGRKQEECPGMPTHLAAISLSSTCGFCGCWTAAPYQEEGGAAYRGASQSLYLYKAFIPWFFSPYSLLGPCWEFIRLQTLGSLDGWPADRCIFSLLSFRRAFCSTLVLQSRLLTSSQSATLWRAVTTEVKLEIYCGLALTALTDRFPPWSWFTLCVHVPVLHGWELKARRATAKGRVWCLEIPGSEFNLKFNEDGEVKGWVWRAEIFTIIFVVYTNCLEFYCRSWHEIQN